MKFIHIADVHLGASPDAGSAYSKFRGKEIWTSLERVIDQCEKGEVDLLLIAGDLFHRQPLLRELKEVNALFSRLTRTQVVLCAGNHDYLKKNSYYYTFSWEEHVHMILEETLSVVELSQIQTAVYGFSYTARERTDVPYVGRMAEGRAPIEILMVHGGDEQHVPVRKEDILKLGYDYVALGHIHKPQNIEPGRMAYSGALEPIDKNDVGAHGYVLGEVVDGACRAKFVPFASREYVHAVVNVTKDLSAGHLKERIRESIEQRGIGNLYKLCLKGFRDPDILFDLQAMDTYGNIVEIFDDTKPFYDFERIKSRNKDNILGRFIEQLEGHGEDTVQYRAMCEGVRALMETKRC